MSRRRPFLLRYRATLRDRPEARVALVYGALAVSLWPVPVLQVLHAESCALLALVGFFAAGHVSVGEFRRGSPFPAVLVRQIALLGVPLYLLTLSAFWAPNHGYLQGLLFFGLFPVVSVSLGVALAFALSGTRLHRPRSVFWMLGTAVVLVGPLFDLGRHPQFYSYNHVFGGVLGPVYDEELAVRAGLFAFRGVSLTWAALLWVAGRALRSGWTARRIWCTVGLVTVLAGAYAARDRLGINTTEAVLQNALAGHRSTEHFDIYYDPGSLSEVALHLLADEHEFRFEQLVERTGITPSERVASYVYPDADARAGLQGARYTNVAPVWLARPQTHVLQDAFADVFPHELAHVFSRSFGLPGIRASVSVGLVEGWAVALEPPDGRPGVHDQVAAAVQLGDSVGFAPARNLGREVAGRLSALGFWTGRGAVSYTMMGSFVRFLIDRYGADRFARAYAWARFEEAYGLPADSLAAAWAAFLSDRQVTGQARTLTAQRFSVPSLFERPSPHYVPRYRRWVRRAVRALAGGDTTAALAAAGRSLALRPGNPEALSMRSGILLRRGHAGRVLEELGPRYRQGDLPLPLLIRLADAAALGGREEEADRLYREAQDLLPRYERSTRALLELRRRLLGAPGPLRAFLTTWNPQLTVERLKGTSDTGPEVDLWLGYRFALEEDYAASARYLERAGGIDAPGLARIRLAWLGTVWEYLGRYDESEEMLQRAIEAYGAAGDFNEADRLADRVGRVRWRAGRAAGP